MKKLIAQPCSPNSSSITTAIVQNRAYPPFLFTQA